MHPSAIAIGEHTALSRIGEALVTTAQNRMRGHVTANISSILASMLQSNMSMHSAGIGGGEADVEFESTEHQGSLLARLQRYFHREIRTAAVHALAEKEGNAKRNQQGWGWRRKEARKPGQGTSWRRKLTVVSQNGLDVLHLWLVPLLLPRCYPFCSFPKMVAIPCFFPLK